MAEALIDGRCTDGPYPLFEYEWVFVNRQAEGLSGFCLCPIVYGISLLLNKLDY